MKEREEKLIRTEKRMLRWSLHISLKDSIIIEEIGKYGIVNMVNKMQKTRLWWFEHIISKENQVLTKTTMKMEVEGSRRRSKLRRRDYEK